MASGFYRISRTSTAPGAVLVVNIDNEQGQPGPGIQALPAKDPDCEDPDSPLFMTEEERIAHPDGVVWGTVISEHQLRALEADPDLIKHFSVVPLT